MNQEPIVEKIRELCRSRRAVILAHNYQRPEVQDLADFVGDSLELSRRAAATDAEVIVFCGVRFMAETASILSPQKTVLLPDPKAGCPMADMITPDDVRRLRREHTGTVVVCYVNTSAEVKAECDLCCTSANAVEVVRSLDAAREVVFVPDRHLGEHVASQVGRSLVLWPGYCSTHVRILPSDIDRARRIHPRARVLVHPECTAAVRHLADGVLSTGQMGRYVASSPAGEFIIGTEVGILHRLRKENPGKAFYAACQAAVCPNMRYTTLEKVLWALQDMVHEVRVPDAIASRARMALERMIADRPANRMSPLLS